MLPPVDLGYEFDKGPVLTCCLHSNLVEKSKRKRAARPTPVKAHLELGFIAANLFHTLCESQWRQIQATCDTCEI